MLTGNTRYRIGFRKKLIMQVECWYLTPNVMNPRLVRCYQPFAKMPYRSAWRDATVEDMQAIERGEVRPEQPEATSWSEPPPKPSRA